MLPDSAVLPVNGGGLGRDEVGSTADIETLMILGSYKFTTNSLIYKAKS